MGGVQPGAVAGSGPGPMDPTGCPTRETWQELTQKRDPLVDLGPCVQGTIHDIEDHSRDHLLPRVRALCQVKPPSVPCSPEGSLLLPENLGRRRLPVSLGTCTQPSRAFAGVTGQGAGQASCLPHAFGAEGQGQLPEWPEGGALSLWMGWDTQGLGSLPLLRPGSLLPEGNFLCPLFLSPPVQLLSCQVS